MEQEQLIQAQNAYQEIINAILKVGGIIEEKVNDKNKYQAVQVCAQFDVLLQYSLLEIAISDRVITDEELDFIKSIVKYGDLVEFFNQKAIKKISWDDLKKIKVDITSKFIKLLKEPMVILSQTFMQTFENYEVASDDVNYINLLRKDVSTIVLTTAYADGKAQNAESNYPCFINLIIEAILTLRQRNGKFEVREDIKLEKSLINQRSKGLINYDDKELGLVYIETDSGSGSGFIISPDGKCFTCCHVVEGAKEIYVRVTYENDVKDVFKAETIYIDKEHDMAVIQILDAPTLPYFELETDFKRLKTGEDVAVWGFPYGTMLNEDVMELAPSLTKGYISSRNKIEGQECYFLDVASAPGNSGGPVFLLSDRKVIGYLCGSYGSDRSNLIFMRSLQCFIEEKLK